MSMLKQGKKILVLSASAVVSLSATAVVAVQQPDASGDRLKRIQSALRDGVAAEPAVTDSVQMAQSSSKKKD
jgi:hypothetical protein